jgi:hypothetical protein
MSSSSVSPDDNNNSEDTTNTKDPPQTSGGSMGTFVLPDRSTQTENTQAGSTGKTPTGNNCTTSQALSSAKDVSTQTYSEGYDSLTLNSDDGRRIIATCEPGSLKCYRTADNSPPGTWKGNFESIPIVLRISPKHDVAIAAFTRVGSRQVVGAGDSESGAFIQAKSTQTATINPSEPGTFTQAGSRQGVVGEMSEAGPSAQIDPAQAPVGTTSDTRNDNEGQDISTPTVTEQINTLHAHLATTTANIRKWETEKATLVDRIKDARLTESILDSRLIPLYEERQREWRRISRERARLSTDVLVEPDEDFPANRASLREENEGEGE